MNIQGYLTWNDMCRQLSTKKKNFCGVLECLSLRRVPPHAKSLLSPVVLQSSVGLFCSWVIVCFYVFICFSVSSVISMESSLQVDVGAPTSCRFAAPDWPRSAWRWWWTQWRRRRSDSSARTFAWPAASGWSLEKKWKKTVHLRKVKETQIILLKHSQLCFDFEF